MPPDPRTSPDGSPRVLAGPLSTTGFKGDSPALNSYFAQSRDKMVKITPRYESSYNPAVGPSGWLGNQHGQRLGLTRSPEEGNGRPCRQALFLEPNLYHRRIRIIR
ncbi:MAG: hypothetical protein HY401_02695 [Elusimicrobia bacterium]|nr:hypothetical protein [Elusimicrobiota bacterium]